jgi:methylthioribose-1-phosphate isomerase
LSLLGAISFSTSRFVSSLAITTNDNISAAAAMTLESIRYVRHEGLDIIDQLKETTLKNFISLLCQRCSAPVALLVQQQQKAAAAAATCALSAYPAVKCEHCKSDGQMQYEGIKQKRKKERKKEKEKRLQIWLQLPAKTEYIRVRTVQDAWRVIRDMNVSLKGKKSMII